MMKMLQMTHHEAALLRVCIKIRVNYHSDLAEETESVELKDTHAGLANEYRQLYDRMGEL